MSKILYRSFSSPHRHPADVTQKWVLPKEWPESAPVDSKVVLPKAPLNWNRRKPGHGGSPASLGPVSGGLLFIRARSPVKLPVACAVGRSLSSVAPLPASRQTG